MNLYILLAFAIYACILLCIGLAAHRQHTTESDFVIGGRSMNYWVTALTAHASDMSSWLFMGLPMAVFLSGISQAWIALGLVSGMFANWHFIAPKLRIATEELEANTLSSYLAARLNDTKGWIRYVSSAITLVFMTHYLAAGLIAMGYLFESVFQVDYHIGITVATVVVVAYTLVGGYVAVAWADTFQGLFLLVMIILVPAIAYCSLDSGAAGMVPVAGESALHWILIGTAWGLGYFGSPHILTKFMGINDVRDMQKAKWVGISWQIVTLSASICVGLVGAQFFASGLANPELVFVEMVKALFHPLIAGFILCGILAATISTMDSQILVVSGVMSEDLYRCLLRPKASSEELLWASRLSLILATATALFLAWDQSKTVLETVFYSWTGLGSAFGPLIILALYWKRLTLPAAVAGMLSGSLTAALLPPGEVPAMIPAFVVSFFVMGTVSMVTQPPVSE